jgi:transcriptional regulator with XRE-family HTH domain
LELAVPSVYDDKIRDIPVWVDDMRTLRDLIVERLAKLKLSQKELAERAGLKPTYVNDLLFYRKQSIQPRFVSRLAAALQVAPKTVLDAIPRRKRVSTRPKLKHSKQAAIPAQSPHTKPLYSPDWPVIMLDPYINGGTAIPLFREPFGHDLFALLAHQRLPTFKPLPWPAALGRPTGTYAVASDALGASLLFEASIIVAAPERAIAIDDHFICYVRYTDSPVMNINVTLRKLLDADADGFLVQDPHSRAKDYIPRYILRRAHRVIAALESGT